VHELPVFSHRPASGTNQYREGIIMVVLSITNPAFQKRAMQMSPDEFHAIANISLAPE
jgi:hypothetical protein